MAFATEVAKPVEAHAEAAKRWAQARSNLFDATQGANLAEERLQTAKRDEEEAWRLLENEAGRGVPTPMTSRPRT